MKFIKLSTIALLPFIFNANASEPTDLSLIDNCLSLKSTLANAFAGGEVTDKNKASFHYQNLENGFKGVCSNAQFFIEDGGLKNTEQNQRYVFIWSAVYNAESPELSVSNIQYSVKQPKNIQVWLQEKI